MKVLILAVLVAVAAAQQYNNAHGAGRQPQQPASYNNNNARGGQEPPQPYNFNWAVKDDASGNDYGHQESSDGRVVSGSYRVLLPDGRVQVVSYTVEGDKGYQAKVTYEGEPRVQHRTGQNPHGSAASGNRNY